MSGGFILNGTRYEWAPLADIVIADQIRTEHWLNHAGREFTEARTWDDVLNISEEINNLGDYSEQQKHPEFKFALSMTIWLAKRKAGEDAPLGEVFGQWSWADIDFWADDDGPDPKGDAAR